MAINHSFATHFRIKYIVDEAARMAVGKLHQGVGFSFEPTPVFGRPGVVLAAAPAEAPGVALGTVAHAAGTVIVFAVVETVPPNAKALPCHDTVLPIVIPDASMSVPTKVEFAPSVVAAMGVHQTSQADAPPANVTIELAEVVSAPSILKM